MKPLRIFYASLVGLFTMFGLSYLWHGVLLNDLKFLQYDVTIFLGLLACVYSFIALGISFILMLYKPTEYKVLKHTLIGVFIGFILYFVILILGSALAGKGIVNNVLNFVWQMIEQGIGAFMISVFYSLSYRRDKIVSFSDAIDA